MHHTRRRFVASSGGLTVLSLAVSAGLIRPALAQTSGAWNKAAFETKTFADTAKALGAADVPAMSAQVTIGGPDIAENGAVVPVTIASALPKTEVIAVLVEKNPNALAAQFTIPQGTDPNVSVRIKMAQTSDVFGLVRADGKWYYAKKEVKVTLGGCGG
ncbi:MAG TPA: thiosulfate oxidation carrier protein SoxY [Burkholderiaceae bacterium]|nr:thiosulfate oxidation carrier protein SoxY [Burkholderiaceae bacterium]